MHDPLSSEDKADLTYLIQGIFMLETDKLSENI